VFCKKEQLFSNR